MSKTRTEVLEESRRKGVRAGAAAAATVVLGARDRPGHRGGGSGTNRVAGLAVVDAPGQERHQVLGARRA